MQQKCYVTLPSVLCNSVLCPVCRHFAASSAGLCHLPFLNPDGSSVAKLSSHSRVIRLATLSVVATSPSAPRRLWSKSERIQGEGGWIERNVCKECAGRGGREDKQGAAGDSAGEVTGRILFLRELHKLQVAAKPCHDLIVGIDCIEDF